MTLFLIRHGETASNAARVVQTPETPLNERGLEQTQRLARRLAEAGIARILSSDLARASMTAEVLRAATGAGLELEPLLQERNFGDVRGTAYADLGTDLFAPDYAPPGGETWEVFHARVDAAWERVQEAAARTASARANAGLHLAVVTHGLVCHSLLSRHIRSPGGGDRGASARLTPFANTSVTVLEGPSPWAVRLANCTAHLGELGERP